MRSPRVWLAVGCLSWAAWGCDRAPDAASISGVASETTALAGAGASAPVYDVTPIDAVTGLRVNASGDVVGWTTAHGPPEPMLYTRETGVVVLPTDPGAPYGAARDLTDRAGGVITVVGEARFGSTGTSMRAVRWRVALPQGTVTEFTDLGALPGHVVSAAYGVNGAGQITGVSDANSSLATRSFLFTTRMVDMGLGGPGQSARAVDLNGSGLVTGYLGLTAFRWSSAGGLQSLGAPAGWAYSFGSAINDAGQVAGSAANAYGTAAVVARYSDGGGWQVLGGMGRDNSGNGINRWGDVVGTGFPRTGSPPAIRGLLYTDQSGALVYVDDLLRVPGSWRVMAANDINDARQITGWAIDVRTGVSSAVLLTPVADLPVNAAPVARFTVTCSPGQCVLDAGASTDDQGIVSYAWKAAKKIRPPATGVRITRAWVPGGVNTWQETLRVTDGGGLAGTRKQTIAIPPP